MSIRDQQHQEKLCHFMEEYDSDLCSLELLLFLVRHPHTRFSRLAIVHALNSWRLDVEKALQNLKNKGLITVSHDNGTTYYSLTENESVRYSILDLLEADAYSWRPVLHQHYSLA